VSSPPHRHPAVSPPASHLDLLAIARQIRQAAATDDRERLHAELARLRAALVHHIHAEDGQFDALSRAAADMARDGQRRLLRLLSGMLFGTADGADGDCNCLVRAAEIELTLGRQAILEATLLRRHPRTG
jgi:hypothetical protein